MARSSDLMQLLVPDPAASGRGVQWRKGLIVTWDPETAENTVLINGAIATNVPILNTSEAAILAEGDVVGLISFGSTWGILGRFTIPGSPEAVSALSSLRTASASVTALDTITSTSYVDAPTNVGPTINITVGASGRLLVFPRAHIMSQAPSTAAGNSQTVQGGMGFTLSGANTAAVAADRVVTLEAGLTVTSSASQIRIEGDASAAILIEGLNPGLTTLTAKYRSTSGVTTQVTNRTLTAMAI